jgi:N-acetylmuramoyl-L-alanine amidase
MQKGKISEMKKLMFPLALLLGVIALGTTPSTESPALQAQNNRQQQKPPFIVCIDPGHPSETSAGANAHGLSENRLNWQVAVRLAQRLGAMNIPYVLTKASEKQYVTNRRRAEIANGANPYRRPTALFIRLHCDVGSGRGFTWYYPDRTGRKGNVSAPARCANRQSQRGSHHEQRHDSGSARLSAHQSRLRLMRALTSAASRAAFSPARFIRACPQRLSRCATSTRKPTHSSSRQPKARRKWLKRWLPASCAGSKSTKEVNRRGRKERRGKEVVQSSKAVSCRVLAADYCVPL